MNTFNADLGQKVLDAIEAKPAAHDQWLFVANNPYDPECGTTMCIAGHAAIESGKYRLGGPMNRSFIDVETGESADIERIAMELLGLTREQAGDLFYTMSNAEALEKLRDLIEKKRAEEGRMCE